MSSSPARTAVVPTGDGGSPYAPTPYVVRSRKEETSDIATLVLAPADGVARRPFSPGQFNMVYAFGVGEAAISAISASCSVNARS